MIESFKYILVQNMGKAENNGAVDAEKVTEDFTSLEAFVSDLSSSSSQITQDEQNDIGASMLSKNETVAKKLENQNKSADISLKWLYGIFIILVLGAWEFFVIYFSLKQLNPCDLCVRKVSDTVFVALLTSATANILALPAIILNYLFPKKR